MSGRKAFDLAGVMPACLLPFDNDLEIDEPAFRKHLRDVVSTDGLSAITINCHSTEVATCSLDEQKRVLDIALDEVGDRIPVIAGVFSDSSKNAAEIARLAERGGASALLVFPPSGFSIGAIHRPEMTIRHHSIIAAATDLPLIYFQFPLNSGYGVPLETIERLADEVPSIGAVKDGCNDPTLFEMTVRTLQSRKRPVNVLTTNSTWLLSSLAIGCAGILSGSGSTIADLHVALFRAVKAGDLKTAQAVADRIFPISQAFYAPPHLDMHNRMKEAQVILGRLPLANVRPPLHKLAPFELTRIREAFEAAGILDRQVTRAA